MPIAKDLLALLSLQPDWDSYGALPVDPATLEFADGLLARTMRPGSPKPTVVPTPSGGVQLEWHRAGIDLEVEVVRPGHFLISVEGKESFEAQDDPALISRMLSSLQ